MNRIDNCLSSLETSRNLFENLCEAGSRRPLQRYELLESFPQASNVLLARIDQGMQEEERMVNRVMSGEEDFGAGLIANNSEEDRQNQLSHLPESSTSQPSSLSSTQFTHFSSLSDDELSGGSGAHSAETWMTSLLSGSHILRTIRSNSKYPQAKTEDKIVELRCVNRPETTIITNKNFLSRKYRSLFSKPYCCCFPHQNGDTCRFRSKSEWVDHEIEHHRNHYVWKCNTCLVSFRRRPEGEEHLIQKHCRPSHPAFLILAPNNSQHFVRPVQEEQCSFCLQKSFSSMDEFFDHLGQHMEAGFSRFFAKFDPIPAYRPQWVLTMLQNLRKSCLRVFSQIIWRCARMWTSGYKPLPKDPRVTIFNDSRQRWEGYAVSIDTGSEVNLIDKSLVNELRLPTRSVQPPLILQGVGNQEVLVDSIAQPEWRYIPTDWDQERPLQTHRDYTFHVVDGIHRGSNIRFLIGEDFIRKTGLVGVDDQRFTRRVLILKPIKDKDKDKDKKGMIDMLILSHSSGY